MSKEKVTAAQLIDRLRAVYEAEEGERLSDEKLAGRLPITLSTFNRWKKGDTRAFRDTIAMLDKAGWLSTDGDARVPEEPPRDRLAELQDDVSRLLLGQAELVEEIQALRDVSAAQKPAAPTKKAAAPKRDRR